MCVNFYMLQSRQTKGDFFHANPKLRLLTYGT